jgi:hypothetical protein
LLACVLVLSRRGSARMDYALATATMLVASPVLEAVHMVVALIPLLILAGSALEQEATDSRSIFGARLETALFILATLLLMFSPKFVSYTAAVALIYVLCVARYLPRAERPRVQAA